MDTFQLIENQSESHDMNDDDILDPERSKPDDFEIISRIGSGSFGTVYKVRRIQDHGIYVIKNVRISELSKKEQYEAINEVDLLAKMNNLYVVKYFDSFISHNSLQIVMEFCNKGDLQKMIKRAQKKNLKSLGEKSTWSIIIQIMLGMHYIHSMKVLHRDMKSANVFLTKDPSQDIYRVKIGDLGVAKVLDSSTAFAQSIVGTPYYLSPELCADLPYRDKSDVWAFGVILYECCMLAHPFDARNQCALIMKIVQAQMAPVAAHVPPDLRALILWILQKDPKDRPKIRDILNERTVRARMDEHGFDVPDELLHAAITDRIGESSNDMAADKKASTMGGRPAPRPAPKRQTPGNQTVSDIRGGRVRGRPDAKISSSKARERHQVKSTPSSTVSTLRERQMVNALSKDAADGTTITTVDVDMKKTLSKEGAPVDWDEARRLLDEIADSDRDASGDRTISMPDRVLEAIPHEGSVDVEYADDFEDYEEEAEDEGAGSTLDSTLQGEKIGADSSMEHSSASETLCKEVRHGSVSPRWSVRTLNNSHANDVTLVSGRNSFDEGDTYKAELKRTLRQDLEPEFVAGLEQLSGVGDDDDDITEGVSSSLAQDRELWQSIWSQGRGVLASNRHIDADALEDGEDEERQQEYEVKGDGDKAEDSTPVNSGERTIHKTSSRSHQEERLAKHSRRAKILEGLIEDSKARTIEKLGENIFTRVYQLMTNVMYTPLTKEESEEAVSDSERKELEELEKTLSDKFNGDKHEMCEVVFDIKRLLAIESSLDRLHQSLTHTTKK